MFLSISEAAAFLSVSRATIYRLAKSDPDCITIVHVSKRRVAIALEQLRAFPK